MTRFSSVFHPWLNQINRFQVVPDYPDKDFPWTFYFNGVALPKWGACWPRLPVDDRQNWDWGIGPRDYYIIHGQIHRVGKVESANPHAFVYAVQELLCLLFTEKQGVMEHCRRLARGTVAPREIYDGLVAAAFEMRASARTEHQAFWISGYEADRLSLVEAMQRAILPQKDPQHRPPPHIQNRTDHLKTLWQIQLKTLHQAASARNVSKELRKKLLEL